MNPERIIAGLDIGSSKTTAVIAQAVGGDGRSAPTLKILGVGQARTTGLRRGVVSDIEETTRSIKKAVEPVPQDRELLHAIPQEYSVDKNQGIRDPIGMIGTRLETEMYLVTIGASPAMNLRKSVERAGYHVRELVLEPLASSLSVLTEDEKELGVALVEMGAGTTDIAVFHEGKIRYLGTVNYGGNNVTSDIVQGIGVTQADAERLKEKYGCAYEPLVDPTEVIQLPSTVAQGDRHIPREVLAHIIHQRMDEIFNLVLSEIERAGFAQRLNGGVVISGGAAAMQGVAELAADVFGTGVRIGSPAENIGGLSDSVDAPRFATVVGLALYGAHRSAAGFAPSGRHRALAGAGVDRFTRRIKSWLEDFF